MPALLLAIIYLIFISLGLPDGVFGGAWPSMHPTLGVGVSLGGVVSLIVTVMAITSSLLTSFLVRTLGIGRLIALSIALTALGLVGYGTVHHAWLLVVFAVPLGFGSGAIDAALNNYVAIHYKARHMNWLHACWGVGATVGPLLFAAILASSGNWHKGFSALGLIQTVIAVVALAAVPLWVRAYHSKDGQDEQSELATEDSYRSLLASRKAQLASVSFTLYISAEVSVGLWGASYLVSMQGFSTSAAAFWTSMYFAGITVGRVATGFMSLKVRTVRLVRVGIVVSIVGMVLLFMHASVVTSACGIVLIGLGFAPIYPGLMHRTPYIFGKRASAKIMSLQMVGGFVGATVVPPLIGLLSGWLSFTAFALVVVVCGVLLLAVTEALNGQGHRVQHWPAEPRATY